MPLCVAHPIALAALAVLAIGLISYNIITNKKKKIPVRERRIEYIEDYKSEVISHNPTGVRKRRNANTEIKMISNEKTESKKKDNVSKESNNHSCSCCNRTQPDFSPGSTVETDGTFNNLDSLTQKMDKDRKILNTIHNINREESEKLNITKTVVDDDAQSTASNISVTNASDLTGDFLCSDHQNSTEDSEASISEKLYKKEVCECLRNEIETISLDSHADSYSSENYDDDDILNLRDIDDSAQKPVICRGCEESYANAVAYPCGHRYLCLDCAIKVHRIYKKCSVCNFHIDTYDIYNT